MAIAKTRKKSAGKSPVKKASQKTKTGLSPKRKQAIEKMISFWKDHAVDMSSFKFNREEANAR